MWDFAAQSRCGRPWPRLGLLAAAAAPAAVAAALRACSPAAFLLCFACWQPTTNTLPPVCTRPHTCSYRAALAAGCNDQLGGSDGRPAGRAVAERHGSLWPPRLGRRDLQHRPAGHSCGPQRAGTGGYAAAGAAAGPARPANAQSQRQRVQRLSTGTVGQQRTPDSRPEWEQPDGRPAATVAGRRLCAAAGAGPAPGQPSPLRCVGYTGAGISAALRSVRCRPALAWRPAASPLPSAPALQAWCLQCRRRCTHLGRPLLLAPTTHSS